jgi:hypothetical protein
MKVIQEVTDWTHYPVSNHIYFTDDSRGKMYAYVKQNTGELFEFKVPLRFDVRGRKFTPTENIWQFIPKSEAKSDIKTWQVQGSKEVYTVTEEEGVLQCNCPSFKFRGKCRHLEMIK